MKSPRRRISGLFEKLKSPRSNTKDTEVLPFFLLLPHHPLYVHIVTVAHYSPWNQPCRTLPPSPPPSSQFPFLSFFQYLLTPFFPWCCPPEVLVGVSVLLSDTADIFRLRFPLVLSFLEILVGLAFRDPYVSLLLSFRLFDSL